MVTRSLVHGRFRDHSRLMAISGGLRKPVKLYVDPDRLYEDSVRLYVGSMGAPTNYESAVKRNGGVDRPFAGLV